MRVYITIIKIVRLGLQRTRQEKKGQSEKKIPAPKGNKKIHSIQNVQSEAGDEAQGIGQK
jgi:hypothetical protein